MLAAALVLLALVGGMVGTTWGMILAEVAQEDTLIAAEGDKCCRPEHPMA